jgi:hypothetical protein
MYLYISFPLFINRLFLLKYVYVLYKLLYLFY